MLAHVVKATVAALGYKTRVVATRGGRISVLEGAGRGSLPTIVLLHGLGSSGADYLPLLMRLRPHARRLLAPDFPGHGQSEMTGGAHGLAFIEGVVEALDQMLDEPAVVFGNSLGGWGAIRFALAKPRRTKGLFVASPAGAPSTAEEFDRLQRTLRMQTVGDARRFLELVMHDDRPIFRGLFALHLRGRFTAPAIRTWVESIPLTPPLTAAEVGSIEAPVHLVWGQSDRLLPRTHLDFFRTSLPRGAHVDEAVGVGHSPQLDDVGRVSRDLLEFTRRVENSAK
jgi:pimeloyl-ACP methyl ester carboxylesterase